MPKVPIDYTKTIIYKIVCNDLKITDCYVGTTTDFRMRKNSHKSTCCNNNKTKKYNLKVYEFIRNNGGWENWSMVKIEKYPCNDSNESYARERYWYEQLNSKLNSYIPFMTKEEHKEKLKIVKKQYSHINNKKISEYQKQYKKNNCENISSYMKNYHVNHKEQKEKEQKENVTCECGLIITKGSKYNHEKTKKHLKLLCTII